MQVAATEQQHDRQPVAKSTVEGAQLGLVATEAVRLVGRPPVACWRGLGLPSERHPASLDARVGQYRSLLAGQRVLVVLDNARSATQVRPLLPGGPGCMTLVTSRQSLAGLIAREGAHRLVLGRLSATESRALLAGRLGAALRPRAMGPIVARCAGLPSALAAAAARYGHPHSSPQIT